MPSSPETTETLTVSQLEEMFQQIWLNTSQMPTLLDHWEQSVNRYIQQVADNPEAVAELTSRLDEWQHVLHENRSLLESHHQNLKDRLQTGEKSLHKQKKSDLYRKQ